MARMPYTNFHELNQDWIIKQIKTAYNADNPPPYPVKSVNGQTGIVNLNSDTIIDVESGMDLTDALRAKQDRPSQNGTAGQVLGLDNNLKPVWVNQNPGVTAYDDLTGRPQINGHTLSGEMDGADIGLIDEPATPGTVGQVLTSDGQGGASWQNIPTPPTPISGDYAPVITDSASGPVASFPDGANDLDMLSLIAEIVPIQAGTGDPSPNNLRAISGRGGVTVYKTGINLWNEEWELGIYDISTGNKVANNSNIRNKDLIPVSPNTNYTWYNASSNVIRFVYYDVNKNRISSVSNTKSGNTYSITTPANCFYMAFYYGATEYNNDVSVNYPETDTDYHAYQGIEPILEAWGDIAGTIYGGTIDVITGVLTVNQMAVSFSGNETWVKSASTESYYINQTNFPAIANAHVARSSNGLFLCNAFKPVPYVSPLPNYQAAFYVGVDGNTFSFHDDSILTLTDWTTYVQTLYNNNTPLTICYYLNNPITYQLTAQDVQTLLGSNNIYSDSGNCSVTYRADTKLFILKVV